MPGPYKTCWRRRDEARSEHPPEFANCHSRFTDDSAHSVSIDRICAGNRQVALTIRQDDVFALTNNPKPAFSSARIAFR